MREREVEKHLRIAVAARGGECFKWVSPGRRGVPDRIVLLPGGIITFVETKAPGKTTETHQARMLNRLRELGFIAVVLRHPSEIPILLNSPKLRKKA